MGLLRPKLSEICHFFFWHDSRRVLSGSSEDFSSSGTYICMIAVLFWSKKETVFLGLRRTCLKLPHRGETQKKNVVHVYRSTRRHSCTSGSNLEVKERGYIVVVLPWEPNKA